MNYVRNIISDQNKYHIKTIENIEQTPIDIDHVVNLFWHPNHRVLNILYNYCHAMDYTEVLEIGPGQAPFRLAKTFIDANEALDNCIKIDINRQPLPFRDGYFDFIYSRHVLEDVYNPGFALWEMVKKSKGGFIETPSPLIECMRYIDVDRGNSANELRGFMHHRYLVWSDIKKNTIYFLQKLPLIEKLVFSDAFLKQCCALANNYPVYWSNYFIWDKNKGAPTIELFENLDIAKDYVGYVHQGIQTSFENTNYFISHYQKYAY